MEEQTKNNKKLIPIITLLVIAAVAVIGVWYFNYKDDGSGAEQSGSSLQQGQGETSATVSNDGKLVTYSGVDGQSALSLVKQYTTVETEEYTGIGEYVVSINGVKADSTNNFWGFYVNGEQAQVGAADYVTKNGDQIEWRLEDVTAFED